MVSLAGLAGCDVYTPRRKVIGHYYLVQWQETHYYLVDDRKGALPNNVVFEGTVEKLAWSDRYIAAWRRPGSDQDTRGWMVIDSVAGRIEGPLSSEEFERRVAAKEFGALEPLSVDQAWSKLSWAAW
ncbi:MAG: hypothetical protein AB7O37_14195 [Vicinamibacteria bacterium]